MLLYAQQASKRARTICQEAVGKGRPVWFCGVAMAFLFKWLWLCGEVYEKHENEPCTMMMMMIAGRARSRCCVGRPREKATGGTVNVAGTTYRDVKTVN